jgi:hypothetical protein
MIELSQSEVNDQLAIILMLRIMIMLAQTSFHPVWWNPHAPAVVVGPALDI